MENNKFVSLFAIVLAAVFFGGCAATHEPSNWLPDANDVGTDAYGSWIEVKTRTGPVNGELIATTLDSVFVADPLLHGFSTSDVVSARVVLYSANDLWAAPMFGPILTVSNGWFLAITAPMWIIGGTIAATSRSFDPIVDYPRTPLKEFRRYARFPLGVPPEIDLSKIIMKRAKVRTN